MIRRERRGVECILPNRMNHFQYSHADSFEKELIGYNKPLIFLPPALDAVENRWDEELLVEEARNEGIVTVLADEFSKLLEGQHESKKEESSFVIEETEQNHVEPIAHHFWSMLQEQDDDFEEDEVEPILFEHSASSRKKYKLNKIYLGKAKSKKQKKRKFYLNRDNLYIAALKELENESSQVLPCVEKKSSRMVKMDVLISKLETEIDILKKFTSIKQPIEKVEWSIRNVTCKVVLPTNTVFLNGELIVEVTYSSATMKHKICWEKIESLQWMTMPQLPSQIRKEYMFSREVNLNYHFELIQSPAEPIHCQIQQAHFIWQQDSCAKSEWFEMNGVVCLTIYFYQKQLLEFEGYSDAY